MSAQYKYLRTPPCQPHRETGTKGQIVIVKDRMARLGGSMPPLTGGMPPDHGRGGVYMCSFYLCHRGSGGVFGGVGVVLHYMLHYTPLHGW